MGGTISKFIHIINQIKLSRLSKSSVLLVLAATLLVFGFLIYLAQNWQKEKVVSAITVSGLTYLPEQEISSLIKPHVAGLSKEELPLLKELEEKVESHPFVLSATIENDKACSLNVEVTERIPVAYYKLIDGSPVFIDSTGQLIPFRHISGYVDMPIVSSRSKNVALDSMIADNAAEIIKALNQEKYNDFNYKISELVYTDSDSCFYFLSISNKKEILFGRADLINQKLNTLDKYFDSELYKKILYEKYLVDVRWENEIVLSYTGK